MVKFKNPFKLANNKGPYKEKDQRIVSRWLKELEDEKLDSNEIMDLCIRLNVCVVSSLFGTTTWNRKSFVKSLDQRMKETFAVVNREIAKGKFHDDEEK